MKMLEGLTVLDLTRLLPGPLATQHFADHGARVIKIEDVNRGDYARQDMAIGVSMSHLFHILNRGKESLALDLSRDEGKNIFLTLCKSADIVVENFRPGAMDRLKLGYEDVRKIKPDIIFCAISAFGANSDNREKAAHDINICALSGVSDQMGSGECGPALSNFQVADIAGGALPAINAILTALFHRERTGKGTFLDISMAGSLFASNVLPYATRETFKKSPERGGDILTGALACYGYYETSDGGWIAVGALEPQFWERFCNLIDRPDLIPARLSLDGATKE
ncbi:MAG: CaiB/BaiF CoA-transferase family protein, partial [Pseudomonadota bacterium]